MVVLGLLLIALGALVVVAALFTAELDGSELEVIGLGASPVALFLLGVGAGAAILWGFGLLKYGTKRSLQHRREQKRLGELSDKLDRVDRERAEDRDPDAP